MKNIKSIKNFLFLALVILIPFLDFITYNLGLLNERTDLIINALTVKRLVVLFIIFLIIALFSFFIIRRKTKLGDFDLILMIGSYIFVFFQYNNLKNGIMVFYRFYNEKMNDNQNLYSFFTEYRGEISLLIILILFYFIFKAIKKNTIFIKYLLVSYLSLNFILGLSNVIISSQTKNIDKVNNINHENINFKEKNGKNIYFFIIDAMPPIEVAENLFKTNSNIFLNNMNKKKYVYVPNTKGLYGSTFLSLGSIFNMNTVSMEDTNSTYPTVMKKKNISNLEYNLSKLNYDIKWIGSHFANCNGYNKRYCLKGEYQENILFSYESLSFLKKTPIQPIISKILKYLEIDIEEKVIFKSNNAIEVLVNYFDTYKKPNKSTFYFIHHMISHWPYLVDSSCKYKKFEGKKNIEGIKNAYLCNLKLIDKITDKINELDNEAIVVFQSDHNWELSVDDAKKYTSRRKIFNLIKVNKECQNYLGKKINNINAIRLSLFCANNTTPKLLTFSEN